MIITLKDFRERTKDLPDTLQLRTFNENDWTTVPADFLEISLDGKYLKTTGSYDLEYVEHYPPFILII